MPTPLPDPSDWSGRERPFADADQKAALLAGRPFLITDAVAEFGGVPAPGEKPACAFLVQLLDDHQRLRGDTFVWTKNESPSRLRLVDLVQGSADGVGPCVVKLIEQGDPSRKPFQHIASYRPDDSEPNRFPARARASRAAEPEVDLDDVPF